MTYDVLMYDEAKDLPAAAQSTNINEELGQIDFVFSDKTGTLTCNVMELRRYSSCNSFYSLAPQG